MPQTLGGPRAWPRARVVLAPFLSGLFANDTATLGDAVGAFSDVAILLGTLGAGVHTLEFQMIMDVAATPSDYFYGELAFGATTPVPVPSAIWLVGSGVIGLLGYQRRSRTAS